MGPTQTLQLTPHYRFIKARGRIVHIWGSNGRRIYTTQTHSMIEMKGQGDPDEIGPRSFTARQFQDWCAWTAERQIGKCGAGYAGHASCIRKKSDLLRHREVNWVHTTKSFLLCDLEDPVLAEQRPLRVYWSHCEDMAGIPGSGSRDFHTRRLPHDAAESSDVFGTWLVER